MMLLLKTSFCCRKAATAITAAFVTMLIKSQAALITKEKDNNNKRDYKDANVKRSCPICLIANLSHFFLLYLIISLVCTYYYNTSLDFGMIKRIKNNNLNKLTAVKPNRVSNYMYEL